METIDVAFNKNLRNLDLKCSVENLYIYKTNIKFLKTKFLKDVYNSKYS